VFDLLEPDTVSNERTLLYSRANLLAAAAAMCAGLDSFAALSVMGHLQYVAQATHQTVIATIHQPRSAIWEMFDAVRNTEPGARGVMAVCITTGKQHQGQGRHGSVRKGGGDVVGASGVPHATAPGARGVMAVCVKVVVTL
jgi:hypothetical protein